MEYSQSKTSGQIGPFTTSFRDATQFFAGDSYEKYLQERESRVLEAFGYRGYNKAKKEIDKIYGDAERARAKWACISAKSQREKKKPIGQSYNLTIHDYLVSANPVDEYSSIPKNPRKEGEYIATFTKRSRQRMMKRARSLNKSAMKISREPQYFDKSDKIPEGFEAGDRKPGSSGRVKVKAGVPDPYFVTLTYRKNFKDCEASKEHLNAFFQHFRRQSKKFAYVWKMEPQKRGAIHYHLCLFIPEDCKKKIKEKQIKTARRLGQEGIFLDLLRLEIQQVWARVTKNVDGFTVPLTKFKYIRKGSKKENYKGNEIETVLASPEADEIQIPDIYHELYGTNVRKVENWKMFMGYIYKYMNKEVEENPFKMDKIKGTISRGDGWENPPAIYKPVILIDRHRTGRFWGYSYNLCFDSLSEKIISLKDTEALNTYCNLINNLAFEDFTKHLMDNLKREREKAEKSNNWKLFYKKRRQYRETWKRQKRRHIYNKDKIKNGRAFSVEIYHKEACRNLKYLPTIRPSDYFGNPPHPRAC